MNSISEKYRVCQWAVEYADRVKNLGANEFNQIFNHKKRKPATM